jgi:hypothetical protein
MSRSGQTSPLGKLTAELKTRVAEDTRDELERQAREAGMVLGEYIREVLMIRAHGIEMVRSLYDARLSLVAGIGPESGCNGRAR